MLACNIVKVGKTCLFMKKDGCSYNGGACHSVVDRCGGCSNIESYPQGEYCRVFAEPALKWSNGNCNMATHLQKGPEQTPGKMLNPLKASKRSGR